MSVSDYRLMGQIVAKQAPQLSGKLYRKYVHTAVIRMKQDNSSFSRKAFLDECLGAGPINMPYINLQVDQRLRPRNSVG